MTLGGGGIDFASAPLKGPIIDERSVGCGSGFESSSVISDSTGTLWYVEIRVEILRCGSMLLRRVEDSVCLDSLSMCAFLLFFAA